MYISGERGLPQDMNTTRVIHNTFANLLHNFLRIEPTSIMIVHSIQKISIVREDILQLMV
jgi:hypothetical protein